MDHDDIVALLHENLEQEETTLDKPSRPPSSRRSSPSRANGTSGAASAAPLVIIRGGVRGALRARAGLGGARRPRATAERDARAAICRDRRSRAPLRGDRRRPRRAAPTGTGGAA